MMGMNMILLGDGERRDFDKLMMNGNLGTPATPYADWLKLSIPYSVKQNGEMTLEQVVKNIMQNYPSDSGYIKLVSSQNDYSSDLFLAYEKDKIVLGGMFYDMYREETAEFLYMELRENNRNWIIKVEGIPDIGMSCEAISLGSSACTKRCLD